MVIVHLVFVAVVGAVGSRRMFDVIVKRSRSLKAERV